MAEKPRTDNNGADEPTRTQRPFPNRAINAMRAFRAARALAERVGTDFDIGDFEIVYAQQSNRKRAKLNDPEFLAQRYRELTGQDITTN